MVTNSYHYLLYSLISHVMGCFILISSLFVFQYFLLILVNFLQFLQGLEYMKAASLKLSEIVQPLEGKSF